MNIPVDPQLARVTGAGANPSGAAHLPPGFAGAPLSAATDALGVKLSVTGHDHRVSAASAIQDVYADSTKRLLENF